MIMSKKRYQEIKNEIGKLLKEMREESGYSSPFAVAKELDLSYTSVYKTELGVSLPSKHKIYLLCLVYKATDEERDKIDTLIQEALEIRRSGIKVNEKE